MHCVAFNLLLGSPIGSPLQEADAVPARRDARPRQASVFGRGLTHRRTNSSSSFRSNGLASIGLPSTPSAWVVDLPAAASPVTKTTFGGRAGRVFSIPSLGSRPLLSPSPWSTD